MIGIDASRAYTTRSRLAREWPSWPSNVGGRERRRGRQQPDVVGVAGTDVWSIDGGLARSTCSILTDQKAWPCCVTNRAKWDRVPRAHRIIMIRLALSRARSRSRSG